MSSRQDLLGHLPARHPDHAGRGLPRSSPPHPRHSRLARMAVHLPTRCRRRVPSPPRARASSSPFDELLRRGRPHLPYGEQVIDDLTPEEAEAFLDAILSWPCPDNRIGAPSSSIRTSTALASSPARPSPAATNRSSRPRRVHLVFRLSPKFATALSSENGVPPASGAWRPRSPGPKSCTPAVTSSASTPISRRLPTNRTRPLPARARRRPMDRRHRAPPRHPSRLQRRNLRGNPRSRAPDSLMHAVAPAHICVNRKGGLVRDAPTAGTSPGRGPRLWAGGESLVR